MSKSVKKPPNFVLTPQQREIAEQIRHHAEIEKPEIQAEGRRVKAAAQAMSAHFQSTMQILKAVRKAEGVTLDDVQPRQASRRPRYRGWKTIRNPTSP